MGLRWKPVILAAVLLSLLAAGTARATELPDGGYPPQTEEDGYAADLQDDWLDDYEFDQEDLDAMEQLDDEELQRMMEEYLRQMPNLEKMASEAIKNPDLTLRYRQADGMYVYGLPNGDEFASAVTRGGLIRGKAVFEPVESGFCTLTVDGEVSSITGRQEFTRPGSYLIRMICYSQSAHVEDFNIYEVTFQFRILAAETNDLAFVPAPEEYEIKDVRLDGRLEPSVDPKGVFLDSDGLYQISFQPKKQGFPEYSLSFRRDTQAPYLIFSKDIGEERLTGPLTYRSTEPGSAIRVVYRGIPLDGERDTISEGGSYHLTVSDSCGNERIYDVTLWTTYVFFDKRLIIIAVIVLALWGVYLFHSRKNMRVL